MNAFFFRSRTSSSPRLALLLSGLAAVLGMALVIYATTAGLGVGGDATIYLTSARNFLHGQGLGWIEADGSYRLLPYSPPFYPLALSAAGLLFSDLTTGARWLNLVVVGLTVLLLGWGFYRLTRQAWLAGLLAGLLAASPVLLGVQVWAMTEALFLLTGFTGLLLLLEYLADPRPRWLLLSVLMVGLACLTRYAGLAFIGTAGLALLLLSAGAMCQRWVRAIGYGLLAILPLMTWLVFDFLITGTVSSRSAQPASAYLQRFAAMCPALEQIYLFWLLPDSLIARLPGFVRTALWVIPILAVVGVVAWLRRSGAVRNPSPTPPLDAESRHLLVDVGSSRGPGEGQDPNFNDSPAPGSRRSGSSKRSPAHLASRGRGRGKGSPSHLAIVMALFILVYLIVLAVVQVFTYPPVTLAARMLSPVHLAVLVLLLALVHLALEALAQGPRTVNADGGRERLRRLAPVLVYLVLFAWFGSYAARSALIAREYQRTGIGYNTAEWRGTAILEAVRALPPQVALISNETTAIMYLVDRPAYALQEIYQDQVQADFSVYGSGADDAQRAFREQGAALVLFNATLRDDFAIYGDRLDERLAALTSGLRPVYEGEDGAIYFYR